MVQRPLVSVIVLCYNNYKYLKETLWSVIGQDYPRLQIIISDDASDYFPVDELIEFMNAARTPRTESVIINVNEKNLGTVKHLEYIQEKCKGEYVVAIAGDDVFYDKKVITQFVNEMERLGEDAEVITAQTEMWDINLQSKLEDFVSPEDIELIKNSSPKELYEELVFRCFIPALSFCRRSFFKKIGNLSSSYKIIEDWSTHLRASRLGIKIHWLDIVSMKHREGGVSHGNKANSNKVFYAYRSDFKYIYEQEVLPYLDQFPPEMTGKILDFYDYRLKHYDREIAEMQRKEKEALKKEFEEENESVKSKQHHSKKKANRKVRHSNGFLFRIMYKFTRKNFVILAFAGALLLFITAGIMSLPNNYFSYTFYLLFMFLGCCALFLTFFMVIVNLIFRLKLR